MLKKKKIYTWKTAWVPLAPSSFYTGYDTFFHISIPGFWLIPFLVCVFHFTPHTHFNFCLASDRLARLWHSGLDLSLMQCFLQPGAWEQIQELPGIPLLQVCPLAFQRTLKIIKQSLFTPALCGSRWISAVMNNHLCGNPNQQIFSLSWWRMRHLAG